MAVTGTDESTPAPRKAKRARLEARLTSEQKALFERAAAVQGRSLSDFVVSSAHEAAVRTLRDYEVITLSVRDSEVFARALLDDAEPGERLKAAAKRYRELIRQ